MKTWIVNVILKLKIYQAQSFHDYHDLNLIKLVLKCETIIYLPLIISVL